MMPVFGFCVVSGASLLHRLKLEDSSEMHLFSWSSLALRNCTTEDASLWLVEMWSSPAVDCPGAAGVMIVFCNQRAGRQLV